MRISELQKREPIGEILERTLARFWAGQYGRIYAVEWRDGRPLAPQLRANGTQPWLANGYLNAIFTPDAVEAVFDPIRREFSRSPRWWRRPLQRTYVSLASRRGSARWLAQASLRVSPAVPDAAHKVIIAGNHKIRLLDHEAGLSYGLLKDGFGPDFLRRELLTRQEAADCRLPVPPLVSVAADQTWFSERYVSGTPINRLARPADGARAAQQAARHLHRFLCHTRTDKCRSAYVWQLQGQIQDLVWRNPLLVEAEKEQILAQAKALAALLNGLADYDDGRLITALTHGDFQPANILRNRDGVWLIDWEYSGRRQAGYDGLVFALASRFPAGLADRLAAFVKRGWPTDSPAVAAIGALPWPGMMMDGRDGRLIHAALFLLEELLLHLEENAQPPLTAVGAGLRQVSAEIGRWLVMDTG